MSEALNTQNNTDIKDLKQAFTEQVQGECGYCWKVNLEAGFLANQMQLGIISVEQATQEMESFAVMVEQNCHSGLRPEGMRDDIPSCGYGTS